MRPPRLVVTGLSIAVVVLLVVALGGAAAIGQAAPNADQTVYLPYIRQGCGPMQLIQDGGFEAGLPTTAWQVQSSAGSKILDDTPGLPSHSGTWKAWLGGDNSVVEALTQQVTVPDTSARLVVRFWWLVNTEEQTPGADTLNVEIRDAAGHILDTLETLTDADAATEYRQSTLTVPQAYAGQAILLAFVAQTDRSNITSFFIDDVSLTKYCTTP